jgi:hypothetical protein
MKLEPGKTYDEAFKALNRRVSTLTHLVAVLFTCVVLLTVLVVGSL